MSQFDEEGNGPSSENGPNGDKKDKVEKKRGREKGKLKGILETVSQFGAEGVMINCGVALNGDSEFLQGSHETNGLTVKGLVGHQSAKGGGGESEGKKDVWASFGKNQLISSFGYLLHTPVLR